MENINEYEVKKLKKYFTIEELEEFNSLRKEILHNFKKYKMLEGVNLTLTNMCHFNILFETINSLKPLYNRSNKWERKKIATYIGAGIWYVKNRGWPTGNISKKAKAKLHSDQDFKPTDDHQVPRQKVGHIYLNKENLTLKYLIETFVGIFGKTNMITPEENSNLRELAKQISYKEILELDDYEKIQEFVNDMYQKANIELEKR